MYRFAEILAWIVGIALLGAYVAMRTWSAYASDEGLDAMRRARAEHAAEAAAPSAPLLPASTRTLASAQPDTSTWAPKRLAQYRESLQQQAMPRAVLRIPRLRLEVPVYEDTSEFSLNRGAGHIGGTADVASHIGNLGIAGHRDGFFRPLKDIAVGDEMYLDTVADTRRYQVTRLQIVDPSDVSVLDATATGTVTLVTCYPFYHVGSAPKRFIVHAQVAPASYASDD